MNSTTQFYDLDFRNYDPLLGRMTQVDPMATKYASLTPYNYSFNDPVTFTDVNGADPDNNCTNCEPIFQPYTGFQYNNSYGGYVQDDVIYYRQSGWTGPVYRYAGSALYMDQNVAPGGSGSWQASTLAGVKIPRGDRGKMTFVQFLYLAFNESELGGSWSGGFGTFFKEEKDVFAAGISYKLEFQAAVQPYYTLSKEGEFFVKSWEEVSGEPRLKMYNDRPGKDGNATIGWGYLVHRGKINGKNKREIQFKNGITKEKAQELFDEVKAEMERELNVRIKRAGLSSLLTQNQFDALFDLTYNSGGGAAKKILNMMAEGYESSSIGVFIEGYSIRDRGNEPRRVAESILFVNGVYISRMGLLWPPINIYGQK